MSSISTTQKDRIRYENISSSRDRFNVLPKDTFQESIRNARNVLSIFEQNIGITKDEDDKTAISYHISHVEKDEDDDIIMNISNNDIIRSAKQQRWQFVSDPDSIRRMQQMYMVYADWNQLEIPTTISPTTSSYDMSYVQEQIREQQYQNKIWWNNVRTSLKVGTSAMILAATISTFGATLLPLVPLSKILGIHIITTTGSMSTFFYYFSLLQIGFRWYQRSIQVLSSNMTKNEIIKFVAFQVAVDGLVGMALQSIISWTFGITYTKLSDAYTSGVPSDKIIPSYDDAISFLKTQNNKNANDLIDIIKTNPTDFNTNGQVIEYFNMNKVWLDKLWKFYGNDTPNTLVDEIISQNDAIKNNIYLYGGLQYGISAFAQSISTVTVNKIAKGFGITMPSSSSSPDWDAHMIEQQMDHRVLSHEVYKEMLARRYQVGKKQKSAYQAVIERYGEKARRFTRYMHAVMTFVPLLIGMSFVYYKIDIPSHIWDWNTTLISYFTLKNISDLAPIIAPILLKVPGHAIWLLSWGRVDIQKYISRISHIIQERLTHIIVSSWNVGWDVAAKMIPDNAVLRRIRDSWIYRHVFDNLFADLISVLIPTVGGMMSAGSGQMFATYLTEAYHPGDTYQEYETRLLEATYGQDGVREMMMDEAIHAFGDRWSEHIGDPYKVFVSVFANTPPDDIPSLSNTFMDQVFTMYRHNIEQGTDTSEMHEAMQAWQHGTLATLYKMKGGDDNVFVEALFTTLQPGQVFPNKKSFDTYVRTIMDFNVDKDVIQIGTHVNDIIQFLRSEQFDIPKDMIRNLGQNRDNENNLISHMNKIRDMFLKDDMSRDMSRRNEFDTLFANMMTYHNTGTWSRFSDNVNKYFQSCLTSLSQYLEAFRNEKPRDAERFKLYTESISYVGGFMANMNMIGQWTVGSFQVRLLAFHDMVSHISNNIFGMYSDMQSRLISLLPSYDWGWDDTPEKILHVPDAPQMIQMPPTSYDYDTMISDIMTSRGYESDTDPVYVLLQSMTPQDMSIQDKTHNIMSHMPDSFIGKYLIGNRVPQDEQSYNDMVRTISNQISNDDLTVMLDNIVYRHNDDAMRTRLMGNEFRKAAVAQLLYDQYVTDVNVVVNRNQHIYTTFYRYVHTDIIPRFGRNMGSLTNELRAYVESMRPPSSYDVSTIGDMPELLFTDNPYEPVLEEFQLRANDIGIPYYKDRFKYYGRIAKQFATYDDKFDMKDVKRGVSFGELDMRMDAFDKWLTENAASKKISEKHAEILRDMGTVEEKDLISKLEQSYDMISRGVASTSDVDSYLDDLKNAEDASRVYVANAVSQMNRLRELKESFGRLVNAMDAIKNDVDASLRNLSASMFTSPDVETMIRSAQDDIFKNIKDVNAVYDDVLKYHARLSEVDAICGGDVDMSCIRMISDMTTSVGEAVQVSDRAGQVITDTRGSFSKYKKILSATPFDVMSDMEKNASLEWLSRVNKDYLLDILRKLGLAESEITRITEKYAYQEKISDMLYDENDDMVLNAIARDIADKAHEGTHETYRENIADQLRACAQDMSRPICWYRSVSSDVMNTLVQSMTTSVLLELTSDATGINFLNGMGKYFPAVAGIATTAASSSGYMKGSDTLLAGLSEVLVRYDDMMAKRGGLAGLNEKLAAAKAAREAAKADGSYQISLFSSGGFTNKYDKDVADINADIWMNQNKEMMQKVRMILQNAMRANFAANPLSTAYSIFDYYGSLGVSGLSFASAVTQEREKYYDIYDKEWMKAQKRIEQRDSDMLETRKYYLSRGYTWEKANKMAISTHVKSKVLRTDRQGRPIYGPFLMDQHEQDMADLGVDMRNVIIGAWDTVMSLLPIASTTILGTTWFGNIPQNNSDEPIIEESNV